MFLLRFESVPPLTGRSVHTATLSGRVYPPARCNGSARRAHERAEERQRSAFPPPLSGETDARALGGGIPSVCRGEPRPHAPRCSSSTRRPAKVEPHCEDTPLVLLLIRLCWNSLFLSPSPAKLSILTSPRFYVNPSPGCAGTVSFSRPPARNRYTILERALARLRGPTSLS